MISDEEHQWLKDLHAELWPPNSQQGRIIKLEALRPLTHEELARVGDLITKRGLMTSMFSSSMFGGYGMDVYTHELFPGTGPEPVLRLVEDHVPPFHRLVEAEREQPNKRPGEGRDDAWEAFSKFTHAPQNVEWLASYKMRAPRPRSSYDY